MEYKEPVVTPRLIIHGGAGNILPSNLPPAQYKEFHNALLTIVSNTHAYQQAGHSALDTVTFAVTQLENNPLFNSGHGAVFTRDGVNELEASVMVSRGRKKRGVGVMGLRHVKNPIMLAREMLNRGEDDLEGGNGEHRGPMSTHAAVGHSQGAQGHDQMFGEGAEKLARQWGLEMVDTDYFFTQNRWDEHVKGIEKEKTGTGLAFYDVNEFIPQGTCGAVALDADGICAVATSTGGMTNKLTGRIGDTPTLGAGFWAEEWDEVGKPECVLTGWGTLKSIAGECIPVTKYTPLAEAECETSKSVVTRSTAMSGTGNGDSFLRINAVRTASAISKYRGDSLSKAMTAITGPGGALQASAGDRWRKTGEGEGGVIGIECTVTKNKHGRLVSSSSDIVAEYNCGGMFRASINEHGKAVCSVWRPGQYDGIEKYQGEGQEYDPRDWMSEKLPVVL